MRETFLTGVLIFNTWRLDYGPLFESALPILSFAVIPGVAPSLLAIVIISETRTNVEKATNRQILAS